MYIFLLAVVLCTEISPASSAEKILLEKFNQPTAIKKGNLIATLPVLPKQFKITFDFQPSIHGFVTREPTSVLRFNGNGNKETGWGSQIPGITSRLGRLVIAFSISSGSTNNNWNYYAEAGIWIRHNNGKGDYAWGTIEVSQTLDNGEYMYRARKDGTNVFSYPNQKAQDFHNVTVWAGSEFRAPVAGLIRNLRVVELVKEVVTLPFEKFINQQTEIRGDTLVATLASLPKQFQISFDFKVFNWNMKRYKRLGNIIQFKTERCDRSCNHNMHAESHIPAVYSNSDNLEFWFGNMNKFATKTFVIGGWYTYNITQTLENNRYVLTAYQSGFRSSGYQAPMLPFTIQLGSRINDQPQVYKNVQIFVSDSRHGAQNGWIRNLRVFGNGVPQATSQPAGQGVPQGNSPGAELRCNGPVKCGKSNFCVGFEGDYVYCYGSSTGCPWDGGSNWCGTDQDCEKFSTRSSKYTDRRKIDCTKSLTGWTADACKCSNGVPQAKTTPPSGIDPKCNGPVKCGESKFCVGFEGDYVYCYGKSNGCEWDGGSNACNTDQDCKKFSTRSRKYSDRRKIDCSKSPTGWAADACKCSNGVPQAIIQTTPAADPRCNGPVKCGKSKFCVGFEGDYVYCYGKSNGCEWDGGSNACKTDQDCKKFSTRSRKYSDRRKIDCSKSPTGWTADACECSHGVPQGIIQTTPAADPRCNGPVKCGKSKFCVGFEGDYVYCYGKSTGCEWDGGSNGCKTDQDCKKFSTRSRKYSDRRKIDCSKSPTGWTADACKCSQGVPQATIQTAPAPPDADPKCYGPVKCWNSKFCVGFEGDYVYCYGSSTGCEWWGGENWCGTDQDCKKFSTRSKKYTERKKVDCSKSPEGWTAGACTCNSSDEKMEKEAEAAILKDNFDFLKNDNTQKQINDEAKDEDQWDYEANDDLITWQ